MDTVQIKLARQGISKLEALQFAEELLNIDLTKSPFIREILLEILDSTGVRYSIHNDNGYVKTFKTKEMCEQWLSGQFTISPAIFYTES